MEAVYMHFRVSKIKETWAHMHSFMCFAIGFAYY